MVNVMAAPKGNDYWTFRETHGRPLTYATPELLWESCVEYFEWVKANPLQEEQAAHYQGEVKKYELTKMRAMTVAGLCLHLGIDRKTWDEYRKRDDFSPVTTRADEIIRTQKFEGAAAGLLNANLIARDLGLADRSELTGKDGEAIKVKSDIELGRRIAFALAKAARAADVPKD